jgi:hypothetical protein
MASLNLDRQRTGDEFIRVTLILGQIPPFLEDFDAFFSSTCINALFVPLEPVSYYYSKKRD